MDWLEPWSAVEGKEEQRLIQELRNEVGAGHMLHNVSAIVVGRSFASDDILVQLQQHTYQYAVVHLTWQQNIGVAWPDTAFYSDWDAFVKHRMAIDNQGY